MKIKDLFNIPNILCYIRIGLIPAFVYTYLTANSVQNYYTTSFIIVLSGFTDFADGYIARRFNMITQWGKVIDPIADKLTQAAIAMCLIARYRLTILLLTIFLLKECTLGILYIIFIKKGKKIDGALWFGKISTMVFYIVTFLIISVPTFSAATVNMLIIIAGSFLLFAFIKYLLVFRSFAK